MGTLFSKNKNKQEEEQELLPVTADNPQPPLYVKNIISRQQFNIAMFLTLAFLSTLVLGGSTYLGEKTGHLTEGISVGVVLSLLLILSCGGLQYKINNCMHGNDDTSEDATNTNAPHIP